MTFSIIISVYNVAPYLRECLDSVLAAANVLSQKCEVRSEKCGNVEIICVDDGATDGSGAILDEYAAKDGRVKVIHQMNAGSSAARNRGIEEALGDWIWFVDADDIDRESLSIFVGIEQKADLNFWQKHFFAAGGSFKRDSICSLVNIRVTTMLRMYIHERHSLKAAIFLFDMKRKLDGRFSCVGGYEHMLKMLNRMPRLIASALLTGFHFCFK